MTPHKCPVCEGRTTVPAGFYSLGPSTTNAAAETCRACDGRGIVWDCVGQYHVAQPTIAPVPPFRRPAMIGEPRLGIDSPGTSADPWPREAGVCQYVGVDGTKGDSPRCSNVE